jgi:hypothetical protein
MCEEVSVKVTVNPKSADGTGSPQALNPSLKLEKIYKQIIERETQDKEKAKQKAKELLRFLIAVEAVEKIDDFNAKCEFGLTLLKDEAQVIEGSLTLKLTQDSKSGGSSANSVTVAVVTVGNTTSDNNTLEIDGEFYQESGKDKWRPWWRCDRWLFDRSEEAQKNFFGINQDYTGEYNLNNTNQKIRIALRDLVLAQKKGEESGQVVLTCPFTTVILLERVEGKTASHEYKDSQWKCVPKETVAIKVHQLPTIDHLIPTSLVSGSNPLARGNNLLAVSARANALKADWFPSEVNEWLSREKYVAACRNYIANEAPQESSEYSKIYNGIFK